MSAPLTKSRQRSPASLILETLGISQTKLAEALGVSKTTVTRMLAGTSPTSPHLEAVLRAVVGEERTSEVLAAIPQRRR